MRIAVLLSHFPVLSETFILNRITGLIDRGHEVDIYAGGTAEETVVHPEVERYGLLKGTYYWNIPSNYLLRLIRAFPPAIQAALKQRSRVFQSLDIFRFGKEAASLRLFYGVLPFLSNQGYDVVHSHHGPNGLKDTYLKEAGAFQAPHITSFHGADLSRHVRQYGKNVYRRLFEKGDLFLPVSQGMKKRLLELGCPGNKIQVHASGIELRKFKFQPRRFSPAETIRLLSLGRLVEKKGFEWGIRAAARLIRQGISIEYDIIGSGALRPHLDRLIQSLKVEKQVRLLGSKNHDEVVRLLTDYHLLVCPSIVGGDGNAEGIPNALKEGMAAGLLCVATAHGDISELIKEEVTGFLVPEKEDKILAEKIRKLIGRRETWEPVLRNARRHIEKYYDADRLNDQLVEIYQTLKDEPAHSFCFA